MEKDILRLHQMLQSGTCCSRALVAMALTALGTENPQLEEASASLCLGVRSGLTCGALTGGAMCLSLFDAELAASELIPLLSEWFRDTYEELYGGTDCRSILEDDPANKALRCPAVVENVWRKCRELLEDEGFEPCAPEEWL